MNNNTTIEDITKDMMMSYMELQYSGTVNMIDYIKVEAYTGLTEEEIRTIQENFRELKEKYFPYGFSM